MLQQHDYMHFPVSANARPGHKELPKAQNYQDGNKEDTEEINLKRK